MADRELNIILRLKDEVSKGLGNVSKNLDGFGKSAAGIGAALSASITLPLTLLASSALDVSNSFNDLIARAGAFVDASVPEMDAFKKAAIDAARGTKFSFDQTAEALGAFVGGEITASEASENLGKIVDLALVAKLDNLQDAVNVGSLALTVFKNDSIEVSDVIDTMAVVASNVTTQTDGWATALTNSAGATKAAGFSFKDLNVLMASMVRGGANVNQTWAAINAGIKQMQAALLTPSKQMLETLDSFGLSVDGLSKSLADGPIPMLDYLRQGFDKANESGQGFAFLNNVLGGQAAPEFALALGLTSDELAETASWFDEASGKGENMVNRLRDSISPLDKLKQSFDELKITIGPLIEQLLLPLANALQKAVDWFLALDPDIQKVVVAFGAAMAAIGPVVTILGGLALAISVIGAPIALIILAISAVVGAIVFLAAMVILNWDKISRWTQETWTNISDWLKEKLDNIKTFFSEILDGINQTITDTWNGILNFLKNTINFIVGLFAGFLDWLFPSWETSLFGLFDLIVSIWSSIKNASETIWNSVKDFFSNIWNGIKEITEEAWNGIKDFFSEVWDGIKDIFVKSIEWIMEKLQPLLSAIDRVKSIGGMIGGSISGFVSSVIDRGSQVTKIKDAIITPGGDVIQTDPADYLFATKNPASLAGAGGYANISIYLDGREIAKVVGQRLLNELKVNAKI